MVEEKVHTYLHQQNIAFSTFTHAPAFTCADMANIKKDMPHHGLIKNLFLKDKKKRYYLLVALADTPIELKKLAQDWNAPELRFARPDELEAILGVTPGSVTLFALLNDTERKVTLILDSRMQTQTTIGLHPLRNDMTTLISPQDAALFAQSLGYEAWSI